MLPWKKITPILSKHPTLYLKEVMFLAKSKNVKDLVDPDGPDSTFQPGVPLSNHIYNFYQ